MTWRVPLAPPTSLRRPIPSREDEDKHWQIDDRLSCAYRGAAAVNTWISACRPGVWSACVRACAHHEYFTTRSYVSVQCCWISSHCALHAEGRARLRRRPVIKTWVRVCVCNASHVHLAGLHSVDSSKQTSSIKALLFGAWLGCVSAAFLPSQVLRLAGVSQCCAAAWLGLVPTVPSRLPTEPAIWRRYDHTFREVFFFAPSHSLPTLIWCVGAGRDCHL